jgi:hypothetical protein
MAERDYFQTIAEHLCELINSKPSSPSVEELKDTLRSAVASLTPPEEEPPMCENEDEHDHEPDECDACWAALEAAWDYAEKHPADCNCFECRLAVEAIYTYSASRYIPYLKQTEPQLGNGPDLWWRALRLAKTSGISISTFDPPPRRQRRQSAA